MSGSYLARQDCTSNQRPGASFPPHSPMLRLVRMSVRLFDHNYVVQYLSGVKNTVADFLSCMPLLTKDTDEDYKEDMWEAIVDEERRYVVFAENGYHCSRMPRAGNAARSGYDDREAFENGNSGLTVVEV
ncbi:hypothetical protein NDU88_004195 [Pleurodeles waltl]|uniref:Uncharacterized protein n=1 Tax=Pleurodeles waltl TaxID=8319 RepID=A0AAV7NM08_PLEWA|nr:hypothetical protein NDU88_004195 [Pleurodeles waltl]